MWQVVAVARPVGGLLPGALGGADRGAGLGLRCGLWGRRQGSLQPPSATPPLRTPSNFSPTSPPMALEAPRSPVPWASGSPLPGPHPEFATSEMWPPEVQNRILILFLVEHGKHSFIQQAFLGCWLRAELCAGNWESAGSLTSGSLQSGRQLHRVVVSAVMGGRIQGAESAEEGLAPSRLAVGICGKNR